MHGYVCLTGDVHHSALRTRDQRYLQGTEGDAAKRFVEISHALHVKTTLFVTGAAVHEETDTLRQILSCGSVELGGHNYYAFKPRMLFSLFHRCCGLRNGPRWLQRWDIRCTVHAFQTCLAYRICSWRNHGYRNDVNTPSLLCEAGIQCLSDRISPEHDRPYSEHGLVYVPINVMPDHEYLYHGWRMPGTFDETILKNSPFVSGALEGHVWFHTVQETVKRIVARGGVATLIVHPACMEILDGFRTFEKLCQFLQQYETITVRESMSCVSPEAKCV